jgi:extradiol dioxygenase
VIRHLSYVGLGSPAADEWRTFGPEVLGAELAPDGPDGAVRLRVDEGGWRIAVHPEERDALRYLGWAVGAGENLADVAERLRRHGVAPQLQATRGERPVDEVLAFTDPFGFRHEVGPPLPKTGPFVAGRDMQGFVTGEQGLGHVVLIVPDLDTALTFYMEAMGLALSDSIESGLSLRFLHCRGRGSRHHSLALVAVPGLVGVHHLMLEVQEPDDVGRAYDLVHDRAIPLAMSLGRHTNDLMTSFYARSPSGLEVEYGSGGVVVDDEAWEVGRYDAESIWGHRPPESGGLVPGIIGPFETSEAAL